MLYGDTYVSEYLGFDTEFRQYAPGMVLIQKGIEGFCAGANGDVVKKLDFGLGHAEYKAVLCTQSWREAAVYIFGPTLRGSALKACHTTTRIADLSARKILGTTDGFRRLKRWWRDRLAKPKANSSQGKQTVGRS
jgi:CelD/BcsL family acetyltransferase involved in cellulose biosynthesis